MRRHLLRPLPLILLALAGPCVAAADDLKGAQSLLCTAVDASLCTDDGNCVLASPADLNIPEFVQVNLIEKMLSTTKASGENRTTPIRTLERGDGAIFIQGIEQGHAFSFVISESTGTLSAAVALDGQAVSIFGGCTPMTGAK